MHDILRRTFPNKFNTFLMKCIMFTQFHRSLILNSLNNKLSGCERPLPEPKMTIVIMHIRINELTGCQIQLLRRSVKKQRMNAELWGGHHKISVIMEMNFLYGVNFKLSMDVASLNQEKKHTLTLILCTKMRWAIPWLSYSGWWWARGTSNVMPPDLKFATK